MTIIGKCKGSFINLSPLPSPLPPYTHLNFRRVEPDVKFTCDIDYDPFKVMREKDLKYGFAISLHEYENTIPTLWKTTQEFMAQYPHHIIPANSSESLMSWITNDNGATYNLCHFWSNFEIGSLAFLRSQKYLDFFNHLDKAGGFFYERWGDAPVHSIAAALMLKKSEVHFFYDMGYYHNPFKNCPSEPGWLPAEKCSCDPQDSMGTVLTVLIRKERESIKKGFLL